MLTAHDQTATTTALDVSRKSRPAINTACFAERRTLGFAAGLVASAAAAGAAEASAAGFAALGLLVLGFFGLPSAAGFFAAGFLGLLAGFSVLRLPSLYEAFTCTGNPEPSQHQHPRKLP